MNHWREGEEIEITYRKCEVRGQTLLKGINELKRAWRKEIKRIPGAEGEKTCEDRDF